MKKIINGKLYDTEKAELVINFSRRMTVVNMFGEYKSWVSGELYKTKKGNWFEVIGRDMNGTQINELTEVDAKRIIQSAEPELYMKMYGDVEEA